MTEPMSQAEKLRARPTSLAATSLAAFAAAHVLTPVPATDGFTLELQFFLAVAL